MGGNERIVGIAGGGRIFLDGLRKVGVPKRVRGRGQEAEGGVADGDNLG